MYTQCIKYYQYVCLPFFFASILAFKGLQMGKLSFIYFIVSDIFLIMCDGFLPPVHLSSYLLLFRALLFSFLSKKKKKSCHSNKIPILQMNCTHSVKMKLVEMECVEAKPEKVGMTPYHKHFV